MNYIIWTKILNNFLEKLKVYYLNCFGKAFKITFEESNLYLLNKLCIRFTT